MFRFWRRLLAGAGAGECLLGESVQRFERGLQTLRLLQAIYVIAHSGHAVPDSVQCGLGFDEERRQIQQGIVVLGDARILSSWRSLRRMVRG